MWLSRLSLLALMLAAAAGAQKPRVETFTLDNGLPSAEVYDLEQDATGRLWILGRAGLSTYDGRGFTPVPDPEGPRGEVVALAADGGGRVWAASWRGYRVPVLSYWMDGAWSSLPPAPESPLPPRAWPVLAVHRDDRGVFAVVSTRRDDLWVWSRDAWTHVGPAEGLPSGRVHSVAAVDDEVFVATGAGLCAVRLFETTCRRRWHDPELRGRITALHADAAQPGRLWLLGEDWMGHLREGRLTVVARRPELPVTGTGAVISALLADRAGGVYFGNRLVLYHRHPAGGVRLLTQRQGLTGEGVVTLLLDDEGHVWIGGLRGLTKIAGRRFLSYDAGQGLLEDEVTALAEIAPGRLLLGHDGGLTLLENGTPTVLPFTVSGPRYASRVLDLAADGEGGVWIAANERGLLRRTSAGTLEDVPLPDEDSVFAVELDAAGRLWVLGTALLYVRDGDGLSRVEPDVDLDGVQYFRWLTAAPGERLYLAAVGGLLWLDGETWHRARGPDADADNVYCAFVTPGGEVWAGTRGGLYRLQRSPGGIEGGDLVRVDAGGLRIDRPIYFILRGPRDRFWFGTDDGVLAWDGDRLRQLTVRHGLAGRETNRGAGLVDHRGRVWIGTDSGLSVYQERYDTELERAPRVELRGLEAGGQPQPVDAELRLGHHQSTLIFHVAAITFSGEEEVLYRFRLAGFDPDWQGPAPLSGSEIRYTNVPPGTYRFRVAAGWPGGPWSAEVASPAIVIARPFWRQPWFLALAAAAVALALAGAHTYKTQAIRSRNAELEALNARLADVLAERRAAEAERERLIAELESRNAELERFTYTVSHDLKSPLVTVNGFLGLLEKDAAGGDAEAVRRDVAQIRAAARQMRRLLDELLELSRVGRVVNPSETVALAELAREAVDLVLGGGGKSVEVAVDDGLPVVFGDRLRLLEVLQNLVENAVKYMGGQPAPRVEIGLREGAEPVVYVRDNGIGIDPRYHELIFGLFERLDPRSEGTGIGLALARRIVELHGGRLWVESAGAAQGSTFCFTLSSVRPSTVEEET